MNYGGCTENELLVYIHILCVVAEVSVKKQNPMLQPTPMLSHVSVFDFAKLHLVNELCFLYSHPLHFKAKLLNLKD